MKDHFVNWIIHVDDKKIMKRSTWWNLISSTFNAGYTAILYFFVGWIVGGNAVGIVSIASAYAYQCLSIGVFGVRNVQASDVKKEYSFSDYFYLRIISCIFMYLVLLYYTFFQEYSFEKLSVVLIFGLFKSIEAIEDLYHGEYQRFDRLDIGCILQATRYFLSLIVFVILLFLSKDLILSFFISTLLSAALCYVQNVWIIHAFVNEKIQFVRSKVRRLFFICLPICIGNSVSTYIVNMPKYAIDDMGNDILQMQYGYLVLPILTINLLSAVIYRPIVNKLSRFYYDGEFQRFFKEILKQMMIIGILTLIIVVGGYLIGLRLLGFIYGVDLMESMPAFMVMLIGGGLNTVSAFFVIVLTIQRAQNELLISYIVTLLVGVPIAATLIQTYGIMGASILYLILSICLDLLFGAFILLAYYRKKRAVGESC